MQLHTMETTNRQQASVAVLISRQSRLLVVRRSKKEAFLPGVFELPGGKIDFGESPGDAVVREVREETALETKSFRLVDARSYMSKGGTQHNIELFYLADVAESDQVRISDAHDEFRWIGPEQIDSLDLQVSDPVRVIIERYFKQGF